MAGPTGATGSAGTTISDREATTICGIPEGVRSSCSTSCVPWEWWSAESSRTSAPAGAATS
jgi:hypothetical protein